MTAGRQLARALRPCVVALLSLHAAIPAFAYTPLAFLANPGSGREVGGLSWQEIRDGRPIRFAVNDAGTSDIDLAPDDPAIDEFEAIELAFRTWERIPGVPIHFDLHRTDRRTFGFDGENVIFLADLGPVDYGALTLVTYDNTTGQILDTDIHLNDHVIRWVTSPNAADGEPRPCPCQGSDPEATSLNDVQGIATHEIGHALGLDHSAVGVREAARTPTMYPRGVFFVPGDGERPPNSRYRTLEPDDVIGIQNLYPPPRWAAETAAVQGVVHDRNDRPLFGAHVVAHSVTTGVEVGAMSGVVAGPFAAAAYAIHGLPPDTYVLRVEPLDGSAPGFVGRRNFGGIAAGLIPAEFPALIDLAVSYHRLAFDPASATPLRLEAGNQATVDFRPLATMDRLPRFIPAPAPIAVNGTLNADVTGPLAAASLVYTVGSGRPVSEPLPRSGGAFSATVPQLAGGSLLELRVEVQTLGGETFATEPERLQVGLSCEPLILVSSTGSGRLSAIDTGTLFEVGETPTSRQTFARSFPLGQAFHEGKSGIYVANFGPDTVTFVPFLGAVVPGATSDAPGGARGVFLPPASEIALEPGAGPWGVALSPRGGNFLYVTGTGTGTVYQIDTRTDRLIGQARVGTAPKGMAVTPDGAKLYVANEGSASLTVLSAVSLAPLATIPLAGGPEYVSVTADGSTAVVTMAAADDVAFIDVASDTIVAGGSTGFSSPGAGLVFLAPRLPDGNLVLAGKFQTGQSRLALIDVPRRLVSTLDLGPSVDTSAGLAFHPDGKRAYLVDHSVPELVEFDAQTAQVARRLRLGSADVRDLLAVDAGRALCAAIGRPHDPQCIGQPRAFACLLERASLRDVCSAPLHKRFRRSLDARVARMVRLGDLLEADTAPGGRARTRDHLRRRLDRGLRTLTAWITMRPSISRDCAAALRARVGAARAALPGAAGP